jgi:hypothetical protein
MTQDADGAFDECPPAGGWFFADELRQPASDATSNIDKNAVTKRLGIAFPPIVVIAGYGCGPRSVQGELGATG